MSYRNKFAALLLASASIMVVTQAQADDAASSVEIIRVTADDQGAGGGSSTSNLGTIDVQGAGETLGSGYIVPEDGPKERSTVTHAGIENLLPSSNPYQLISILPGVNQFQDDALGLSGGTIRVRGLVAGQMGFTVNGAPINDSGSFSVYPQELIDAENVQQVWVTQGSTDIDAPHVGASGGNIGVVTRAPADTFNIRAEESVGEDDALREFVSVDSGWIGDFKGFVSFSEIGADKWRGDGRDNRWHSDGNLLYQFLPHSSIGLTWAANEGVNHTYESYGDSYYYYPGDYEMGTAGHTALQTFNEIGRKADYNTFWGTSSAYPINLYGPYSSHAPTCGTGSASNTPICLVNNPDFPATETTNVTNDYALNVNVFKNAIVTVPLHVQVTDDLRWETNGYVWYGDGGTGFGGTTQENYSIVDGYTPGVAYGNAAGSQNEILLYEFEHTLTWRPGVTTKMVYDFENFTFSGGLWYEHASQKQNEPYTTVNANGTPCNDDPTRPNQCSLIGTSAYGTGPVYGYANKVDSVGQSIFGEMQGRFFDDALKVTVGLSDRDIHRSDRTYQPVCADSPNLSLQPGSTHTCASVATSSTFLESAAYSFFGGTPGMTAAQELAVYQAMQNYAANPHVNYNHILPELNATYDIDPFQQVFVGLSTGFRTPSTNNLWTYNSTGTFMEVNDIKPEFDTSYEAGYRFHGDFLTASATAYLQDIQDYQSYVQLDPVESITNNIGGVKLYGIDFEAGTKPWNGFTFYGSAEVQNSVLSDDVSAGYSGTNVLYVHTRGKQLVDTPNWIASVSVGYERDGFFGNLQPHCYGQRATALLNDEYVPANCVLDASVGYRFDEAWGAMQNATLQIYALNLLDTSYLGQISTTGDTNAKTVTNAYSPTAPGNFTIAEGGSTTTNYSAKPGAPLFVGVRLNVNVN